MTQSTFWAEYFVRISDYPFLDAQTEKELGERIMKGSDQEKEDARNSLVLSHLRLAWSLAMEASIHWIDPEDLLQAANTALVLAAKKFDPAKGVRFSTYAESRIRTSIARSFLKEMPLKVSVRVSKKMQRLTKEADEIEMICGRKPTQEELSACLGWDLSSVKEICSLIEAMKVIHITDYTDMSTMGDDFEDYDIQNDFRTETAAMELETGSRIEKSFKSCLSKAEQDILTNRYLSRDSKTLKNLGEEFGKSTESVRRIEKTALRKLIHG